MSLQTPIAFCIFNRPNVTQRVFRAIANAQPKRLLIIGDGARPNRPGEADLVRQTRGIIGQIDWPCEVTTHFSETNLGCKHRMASGIEWAFEQSDELIILEDDCLPHPSFFDYCEAMLQRYRDDNRIMMISGDNFQPHIRSQSSYYFSRWPHIWGWASWRRAWSHFDVNISTWPQLKTTRQLETIFGSDEEYCYWESLLDRQHAGQIDTWDFPWAYAVWKNNGMTILPETNLISNLGFAESATHTTDGQSKLANLPVYDLGKIRHPNEVKLNEDADQYTWHNILRPPAHRKQAVAKPKWYHRFFRKPAA